MSTKNIWFTRDTIVSIMSSVSSILSTCVNFFDIFVHFSQDVTEAERERAVQRQKRSRPRAPSLIERLPPKEASIKKTPLFGYSIYIWLIGYLA